MKQRKVLTLWYVGLIAALAVTVLVACGGEQATSAPAGTGGSEAYTSAVLDTSYAGALNGSDQLALGTIRLEETDNAVTSEQAAALLPLWEALRGGVTTQTEVNAVLKQIEGTMAQEQLQAIAAMQLTQEYLQTWMQEQGKGSGFPLAGGDQGEFSGALTTRRAESEGVSEQEREALMATAQAGGGMPGGRAGFEGMSEEEREALRATAQAGGGMARDRAGFEGMSEEEREALQATAQAGGGMPGAPGGRRGAGGGQFTILLEPLIELLEARAGEA